MTGRPKSNCMISPEKSETRYYKSFVMRNLTKAEPFGPWKDGNDSMTTLRTMRDTVTRLNKAS